MTKRLLKKEQAVMDMDPIPQYDSLAEAAMENEVVVHLPPKNTYTLKAKIVRNHRSLLFVKPC